MCFLPLLNSNVKPSSLFSVLSPLILHLSRARQNVWRKKIAVKRQAKPKRQVAKFLVCCVFIFFFLNAMKRKYSFFFPNTNNLKYILCTCDWREARSAVCWTHFLHPNHYCLIFAGFFFLLCHERERERVRGKKRFLFFFFFRSVTYFGWLRFFLSFVHIIDVRLFQFWRMGKYLLFLWLLF